MWACSICHVIQCSIIWHSSQCMVGISGPANQECSFYICMGSFCVNMLTKNMCWRFYCKWIIVPCIFLGYPESWWMRHNAVSAKPVNPAQRWRYEAPDVHTSSCYPHLKAENFAARRDRVLQLPSRWWDRHTAAAVLSFFCTNHSGFNHSGL